MTHCLYALRVSVMVCDVMGGVVYLAPWILWGWFTILSFTSLSVPAVGSAHLLLWRSLISRQSVSLLGNWRFSHLLVSMSFPTIMTWPFQSKAVFEVVQLTVIFTLNLTEHVYPVKYLLSSKKLLPLPAVAQRLESSTKTRAGVVLILTLSFFFCCYKKKLCHG